MLTITIPSNNVEARRYVIQTVFKNFLGLDCSIKDESSNTTIIRWDDKSIIFKDVFWNAGGISISNLPNVVYSRNVFVSEEDIPILYGDSSLNVDDNIIECGIDFFASIFFMLSRWEEYEVRERDCFNRFVGKESIAFKFGFLKRPVVNEYIEMLWNMMTHLGYDGKRLERKFEIVPTHDIDIPYMRGRFVRISKEIVRSIISFDLKSLPFLILGYLRDPYNTYDFLMGVSEKIGVRSHFYFMSSDDIITEDRESPYLTKHTANIVKKIRRRGHVVGFHPGYFSVESSSNWHKEKEHITNFLGFAPVEGRQHYLRFKMPETFSYWESNNMQIDSTLSYHDVEGFRCGTGDLFPVFDFINNIEYNLREHPLVIMDATFTDYQGYTLEKISEILDYYIGVAKKYRMSLTLLFHNTSFMGYKGYMLKRIYKKILNGITIL